MSFSWPQATENLRKFVEQDAAKANEGQRLDAGQRASLMWIAERLPHRGIVLADEVGTGKTRIACAVLHAVVEAGGRAAVVVPHGLIHQWRAESRKVHASSPSPKTLSTLTEFFFDSSRGDTSWKDLSPNVRVPEWWLISHGFRVPLVRSNSDIWRVALPALVALGLAPAAEREDGRTRLGKLQRAVEDWRAGSWIGDGMARIASEVAPIIRGRRDLRQRIDNLPLLSVTGSNDDELRAAFIGGDGRSLTEELLGLWLGDFDLLVMDEAHKSRDEVAVEGAALGAVEGLALGAVPGKVLSRLVNALLKQPENGRRLCLTATPMELELSQWLDLLDRARSGLDRVHGSQVVERLHNAAIRAAVAPDEGNRLDELCIAAHAFRRTLAPYVTRRRRDDDPVVAAFRTCAALPGRLAHPHRRVSRVQIAWTETLDKNSPWFDVLFAAECMSHSARGLALADTEGWPHAVRDAYTKLSAGHVSIDLTETNDPLRVPEPGSVDDYRRAKIARVAYWYRRLRDARTRVLESLPCVFDVQLEPDAEHPRILAAVAEIESWTRKQEKVVRRRLGLINQIQRSQ